MNQLQILFRQTLTASMGIAKEIPSAILMVLTPIASPSKFTRGPPELPKVIAASVWGIRDENSHLHKQNWSEEIINLHEMKTMICKKTSLKNVNIQEIKHSSMQTNDRIGVT